MSSFLYADLLSIFSDISKILRLKGGPLYLTSIRAPRSGRPLMDRHCRTYFNSGRWLQVVGWNSNGDECVQRI